jgi:phosphate transport system permease protein
VVSDDPTERGLSAVGLGTSPGEPSPGDDPAADPRRPQPRSLKSRSTASDRLFRSVLRSGGSAALLLMICVGSFLAINAWPALHKAGWSFLTTQAWNANGGQFGIAAVIVGTGLIAMVALVVAAVLATGTALYISEYAPRALQRPLIAGFDLMAAVPSVVFGLWGSYLLQWQLLPVARWLNDWFYWFPLFQVNGVDRSNPSTSLDAYSASTFIAGIVVGLMITPIAGSVMREAFGQAPVGEREGALALGGTRWGMITSVVLPFGRGAMIGGLMLGLGRALGETMAVLLIISPLYAIQPHILQHDTSSISSLIALQYAQAAGNFSISALMAAGLALFVITMFVNFAAAQIVSRSRSGAMSEA